MQQHIIELETRIAFQEETIHQLSEELIRQCRDMDALRMEIEILKDRVRGLATTNIASQSEETPPPHY